MNIIETERLVRRIHGILKGEGETAMAPKLAEQLRAFSATVALRLEQCRSMIEAGAAPQAVQLAETPPNLLDLVTLLEFREADEWRQYCQQKGLPVAEKMNSRAVTMLNDCYSRGITPQHPVYAAYREAVLAKNDEAARMALLSIVRLNPGDANAVSELTRLDDKILAERLAKLSQYLASDEDAALLELDRIEALSFKARLTGEVWRRGQLLRCKRLLAESEASMLNGVLTETATQLGLLTQLKAEYDLGWPAEWNGRITRLQDWCQAESMSRQDDMEYLNQLSQLETLLGDHENKSQKKAPVAKLKAELGALRKTRRDLERFARPIPAELQQQCQRYDTWLEQQITRASRTRLIWTIAGVTAAVLILGAMATVLWGMQRSNALADELKSAGDKHQVRQLSSLVKQAQSPMVISTPRLKAALAAANAEILSEMTPVEAFEAAFKKLPTQLETTVDLQQMDSIGDAFSTVEEAHAALAPDLQQETSPRLQSFRDRWVTYCAQMLPKINQQIEDTLKTEDVLSQTEKIVEPGPFESRITEAIPQVEELSKSITNLNRYVQLDPDLAQRSASLLAQLRQTELNVTQIQGNVDGLIKAKDLSEYAQIVNDLASIPLAQSVYQQAARQAAVVDELRDAPEALSRRLLTGDKAVLWNTLKLDHAQALMPVKATTAVRHRFMGVLQDYAVNGNHHRLDIYLDEQRSQHQEWITADALRNEEGWHSVPGWNMNSPGNCEFNALDYGCFEGKYRLSDKVLAFEIKDTSLSELTSIWNGSGFYKLLNSEGTTYNLPPLKVVDALCADRGSSALLRAYLLQELVSIMEQQPEESGIIFTPELRDLPLKLHDAGADQLHSGDWFIATRVAAMQPGLDKLFDSLKSVSYENEAAKFMDAITTAAKDGFSFSGYVKPDGSPCWNSTPTEGYVWGYQQDANEPGLLYSVHDGQVRTVNKALPLTPLVLFSGDLPAILAKIGMQAAAASPKRWLPPLLASLPPP